MRLWVERLAKRLSEEGKITCDNIFGSHYIRLGELTMFLSSYYTLTIRRYDEANTITVYQDEYDLLNKTINKLEEKQVDKLITDLNLI